MDPSPGRCRNGTAGKQGVTCHAVKTSSAGCEGNKKRSARDYRHCATKKRLEYGKSLRLGRDIHCEISDEIGVEQYLKQAEDDVK